MAGEPLQLQKDLLARAHEASEVAWRAQAAYKMQSWRQDKVHRLRFAAVLILINGTLSSLRLSSSLFPNWDIERVLVAGFVETMVSVGLFCVNYYMSFKYRGLMDMVTAFVYVALVLAVVGFNLWTKSTFGILTLLLLTEIVYAFPAAFPMPLPLYLAATGVNIVILAAFFILSALNDAQLFDGVASLCLICIFAALTVYHAQSQISPTAFTEQFRAAVIHAAAIAGASHPEGTLPAALLHPHLLNACRLQHFIGQLFTDQRIVSSREHASVLFCEVLLGTEDEATGRFVWSKMGSNLNHSTLARLSSVFNVLDEVVQHHNAFKVETIGSEYMAVSGLPASARHPANTCITLINVAIGMLDAIHSNPEMNNITLQIGINAGNAVETILGRELLPRWKLFGDTVNTASRMKSSGKPGRIHVSERVRQQAMKPIVAAWKRIDPIAVKQWHSLNKHPKRFTDGTGAGSDVQLRPIELTKLDASVPEFLGFSIDPELPHNVKGKGMMHTHFVNVRSPIKLLFLPQQPTSMLAILAASNGITESNGTWLLKPAPSVFEDAAMAASIRSLMVDELQRLVLTVDHSSARNLTMIGNGQDALGQPPPIIQSSRSSQVLPSVSPALDAGEPEQKHKAALVGLRFMRMLSLADSNTVRSTATLQTSEQSGATARSTGSPDTEGEHPPLQYTASSMSMRDTDTLIGRRPTLNMQNSSASFVVPVTEDSQLDSVLGAARFHSSQRTIQLDNKNAASSNMPRVKSFSVQRARKVSQLVRSSSERARHRTQPQALQQVLGDLGGLSRPRSREWQPQIQAQTGQHETSAVEPGNFANVSDLKLHSIRPNDPSYDILAGDLHKRIRATPEEMSNAIPMPVLNSRTLFFEKAADSELERMFLFYLTGAPNHYLRGSMAILTCSVAFVFVHVTTLIRSLFGLLVLSVVAIVAGGFALKSFLIHLKIHPCPLFDKMPYMRTKLRGTAIAQLEDRELAAIIAQHVYGIVILLFTALHYGALVHGAVSCQNGGCNSSNSAADESHTVYHHAAFHHIVLMILSETLRFRFVQLSALTTVLFVVASVALAVGGSIENVWAGGWILLNSVISLLLVRSNERRRRSDFFLGHVSDEGSKETLSMLYAMLPQAIAKPLLNSVSLDSEQFTTNELLDDDVSFRCCTAGRIGADELMSMRMPVLPINASAEVDAQSSLYEPSTQLVSLLMFDLVGFTKLSATIGPHNLVTMLDKLYASFDRIVRKRQAYKVETIGDAFLVSCGAPEVMPPDKSAVIVAKCAIEMLRRVRSFAAPGGHLLQARVGIHVGRVMAGVISSHMPRYQLFGTEVDKVMLLESSGQAGRVHASRAILQHLAAAPDLQVTETLPDGTGFVDRDRSAAAFSTW